MDKYERYIAIFGPKHSGKTVFLGALYATGLSSSPDQRINISASDTNPNDTTHMYLQTIYQKLNAKEWPISTATMDDIDELKLNLYMDGFNYNLAIPDLTGDILRRSQTTEEREANEQKLKVKFGEKLKKQYEGILIFLPADKSVDRVQYKWELDPFLDILKNKNGSNNKITTSVAIIVSKWDEFSPQCAQEDIKSETEKAKKFCKENYGEIYQAILSLCSSIEVFPVSSTGKLNAGKISLPIQSFNLVAPIAWLLTTIEKQQFDHAKQYYINNRNNLFKRDTENDNKLPYKVIENLLEKFCTSVPQQNLLYREAKEYIREIEELRGKRQKTRILTLSVLTILMAISYYLFSEHKEKQEYLYAENFANACLANFNKNNYENEDYYTFNEKYDSFKVKHPDSFHLKNLEHLKTEIKFKKIHWDLQQSLAKNNQDFFKCYQLCYTFTLNLDHPMKSSIEKERDSYLQKADDKKWEEVKAYLSANPTKFQDCINKVSEYINQILFTRNSEEAKQLKNQLERRWDKYLYEQITKVYENAKYPEIISLVKDKCEQYRSIPRPISKMEEDVVTWQNWYGKLQDGVTFGVNLEYVEIKKGAKWHGTFYSPDVYVTVQIGDKKASTGVKEVLIGREERDFPDSKMESFSWKWNQQKIIISIICMDYSEDALVWDATEEKDPYKIRFFNYIIPFNNGKINVKFESGEILEPSFPPYKE